MKKCCKCKVEKPFEEFPKSKNRKDGHNPYCRSCGKEWREQNKDILKKRKKEYYSRPDVIERTKEYRSRYYKENKEEFIRSQRSFYEENREKFLLKKSRERAKEGGLEHSIELEDIVIPEYCPILGIKLTAKFGQGQLQTNASIDRIDSSKGYVKGNVQVISRKANTMKSNATIEELKKFGEWCNSF